MGKVKKIIAKINRKKKDTETLTRTGTKAIIYRAVHMLTIWFLSLIVANAARATALVSIVMVAGMAIYYLYDRIFLLFPWGRENGEDSKKRTLVKTIIYKIITVVLAFFGSKAILQMGNLEAIAFFVADQVIVTIIYFVIERIYNRIKWGKVIKDVN